MGQIDTMAVVRFRVEGFHNWPEADEKRSYLGSRHRHMFHVEVRLELFGDNREVEFHDLLDYCKKKFPGGELGTRSCEMMAMELMERIEEQWPRREVAVLIFEDGEVGVELQKYYLE